MKDKRVQLLLLTIISFMAGILMMLAVRSSNVPVQQVDPRNEELIQSITAMEAEIAAMEEERRVINEQITAIHASQAEGQSYLSLLSQNREKLRQVACLTELQGTGIIITIDDNKEGADKARVNSPETYFPENFIVHDKDLLYIIRALAPAGEAMAINNVRLNNNSSIRCVGTVILVNNAILAPPYEIRVIGDQETLLQALTSSSCYLYLANKMMPIKISYADTITLPSYSGSYTPSFSKPVKEGATPVVF